MRRRSIKHIVLHHSATIDGGTVSWGAIRLYHKCVNGWSDIGYHLGIELVGAHYEVLLGRPWTMDGAHARGRNSSSLGVCLVGNFDNRKPNGELWSAAVGVIAWISVQLRVPVQRIVGHREVTKGRTCPGTLFDMKEFRAAVAKLRKKG